MAAALDNHYAVKWTFEKTMDRLLFIQTLTADRDIIYLGEALLLAGVYPEIWTYWKKKWCDNPDIMEVMYFVSHHFEVNIFKKATKKEIHTGVAIFALKHHYGWSDRKQSNPHDRPIPLLIEQPFIRLGNGTEIDL